MTLLRGTLPKCPYCSALIKGPYCVDCAYKAEVKENAILKKEIVRLLNVMQGMTRPGAAISNSAIMIAAKMLHGFDGIRIPPNYPWSE